MVHVGINKGLTKWELMKDYLNGNKPLMGVGINEGLTKWELMKD